MLPRCIYNIPVLEKNRVSSDYAFYQNQSIGNYSLNVMNIYTAYYLQKIGIYPVCLSVELTEDECLNFMKHYTEKFGQKSFLVLAYGRVENMIIKDNILDLSDNMSHYQLKDIRGRAFPVYYDGTLTHILHNEKRKFNPYIFSNHWILRYDFYEETYNEVIQILKRAG